MGKRIKKKEKKKQKKGRKMIITILMKFLVWLWNYTPDETFVLACMIFACIETFVEIIGFIMWKDCNKI